MTPRPKMTGEDIVCFGTDWNEYPTSCNHVKTELAKTRWLLRINSTATRTPNFMNPRDLGKTFSKLAGFLRGPIRVTDR